MTSPASPVASPTSPLASPQSPGATPTSVGQLSTPEYGPVPVADAAEEQESNDVNPNPPAVIESSAFTWTLTNTDDTENKVDEDDNKIDDSNNGNDTQPHVSE